MSTPEYINCERKKEVQCEITCLDIKAGINDSMKLLVFKFSKNEKGEKNKDMSRLWRDDEHEENEYKHFQMVSIDEESKSNHA